MRGGGQGCRAAGLLGCRAAGLLGCRAAGLQGCWAAGLQGCWAKAACAARAVSPGGQARAGGRADVKLLIALSDDTPGLRVSNIGSF